MAMAERQSVHREHLEKSVIEGNLAVQKLGSILGFIIAMTTILGGIWLIGRGKSGYGLASIIASLASLVAVFVYGKHQQDKERAQRAEALEKRRNQ
jgi:uncharacterized membrane protein